MADGPLPITATWSCTACGAAGEEDEARAYYAEHPVDLDDDDWFSSLNWCHAGAVALVPGGPRARGRRSTRCSRRLAGMSCSAGSGNASGPVDAYLAMAAAATGETDAGHPARRRRRAAGEEWRIPLVAQWLRDQRDRYGF